MTGARSLCIDDLEAGLMLAATAESRAFRPLFGDFEALAARSSASICWLYSIQRKQTVERCVLSMIFVTTGLRLRRVLAATRCSGRVHGHMTRPWATFCRSTRRSIFYATTKNDPRMLVIIAAAHVILLFSSRLFVCVMMFQAKPISSTPW